MAVGTAAAIGNIWLLAAVTFLFAGIYHYIILDEETKLIRIFGEPYNVYCKVVPRFFPRPLPASKASLTEVNPDLSQHPFSWDLAVKNKAYEAYASFAGLIGFVTLAAYAWRTLGG